MLQDDTDSIHARVLREKLRGPDGESTKHLVSSRRGWGNQDLRNLKKMFRWRNVGEGSRTGGGQWRGEGADAEWVRRGGEGWGQVGGWWRGTRAGEGQRRQPRIQIC